MFDHLAIIKSSLFHGYFYFKIERLMNTKELASSVNII